jgi:hypothetical protein
MIFITGDIHGQGLDLQSRIMHSEMMKTHGRQADYMVDGKPVTALGNVKELMCCGDVGLTYGKTASPDIKRVMGMENPDTLFIVMRGNHDDRYWEKAAGGSFIIDKKWGYTEPDCFGGQFIYEKQYPNILYVKDEGGLYNIGGRAVLFIPGAYSVDIPYRLRMGLPVEEHEQLTQPEMDALLDAVKNYQGRLIVVSHTCPYSWMDAIAGLLHPDVDQSTVDFSMERGIEPIWDNVKDRCDGWYFGHYHHDAEINGTDGIAHMLYHNLIRFA